MALIFASERELSPPAYVRTMRALERRRVHAGDMHRPCGKPRAQAVWPLAPIGYYLLLLMHFHVGRAAASMRIRDSR